MNDSTTEAKRTIMKFKLKKKTNNPRIVVVGAGFGGIEFCKRLRGRPVEVLLLDRHNFHTFQPLLYQVATGSLETGSIAFPIRRLFQRQDNFQFYMAELLKVCPEQNSIATDIGEIEYDYLVIATGSATNFFGNNQLRRAVLPMKTLTEALNLRSILLQNIEKAQIEEDLAERKALLTFVVVGGGPTGVELSGALAELRNEILPKDFHTVKQDHMHIYLIEGKERLIASMSPQASHKAKRFLTALGVDIKNGVHVESYDGLNLVIDDGRVITTRNVIWSAGVHGIIPAGLDKAAVERGNRLVTDNANKVIGYKNIYAIGDVAHVSDPAVPGGYPGVAPVAIQQARLLAENIIREIRDERLVSFRYRDKGSLATVGRNKAVADIGSLKTQGFFAWLIWSFVHLISLVSFRNKVLVFISWVGNYFTFNGNSRIITRPTKRESSEY